jgi:predicted DNA-binding transcriptional regulator AlpA
MARKAFKIDAYSITEFCVRHQISKATYYRLKEHGEGPKEMRIGRRRLISREAAEDWRRQREHQLEQEG